MRRSTVSRVNFPFSPSRSPIFYGWVILVCGTVGILMSVPGQTTGVSVFTEDLLKALKISRLDLSVAYMLGTITSSLALTWAGRMYDLWGARRMAPLSAFILCLTLLSLSFVDQVAHFFISYTFFPSRVVTLLILFCCFAALRFSGQGVLTMVSRNMIMKWFIRRRGFVNSVIGISIAVGFSLATYLLNELVTAYGWSNAWRITALFIGLIFTVFAIITFRDNPEECGLLPDGAPAEEREIEYRGEGVICQNASLNQAKKTYEFWVYALAIALPALSITAVSFHIVSIFSYAGFTRETAIGTYIPTSIISAIFIIIGGWLSDKIRLKYLLMAMMFGQILFSIGLSTLHLTIGISIFVLGMGVSQGMFGILIGISWPKLFGREHLGEVSGRALALTVFGSAIGPLLFSTSLRLTGAYSLSEIICGVIAFFLLLAALRSKE